MSEARDSTPTPPDPIPARAPGDSKGRVLLVLHQERSTPGKIGAMLEARGYELEACRAVLGEPLPAQLDDYAASIMFGGPQSANDAEMRPEIEWLEQVALAQDKPLLGICLGAQALAKVLGAEVGPCREGHIELGYYPVHPVGEANGFLADDTIFYQWHSETFAIPASAQHLARSEACDGQAFRYRNSYAIEFHPEMTFEMIQRWCTSERGAPKLQWPGAKPADTHIAGYARYAPDSDRWLEAFLDNFLAASESPSLG